MATEIERKFLVRGDSWKAAAQGSQYRQGYLLRLMEKTVRVRSHDGRGYLTVKGMTKGATRSEYDYEIPFADAEAMLRDLCEKPLIEKNRYRLREAGHLWEIDEFLGENLGLVVAEIELATEDEAFRKPAWIGEEVTGDPRYLNANLVKRPFSTW